MNLPPQQSLEALKLEVSSLRSHIANLTKYKLAVEAQEKLFHSILMMSNVSAGTLMLRSIVLEITEMARELTKAEDASLFLLNAIGGMKAKN